MAIRQLSLTDFRNLRSTTLDFDSRVNLVVGPNGAGKTSLLEAVFVLCQAHSFRTHQLRQCIQHGKSSFLLFGRFEDFKAGLSRNEKRLEIHVNGEVISRRSELVRRVPVQVVNADSFRLIDGPPQVRRGFVDWCLFHVEHEYADTWARFRHALKQRNSLLKSRRDMNLLDYWDEHLVEPSARLSQMRERMCASLGKMIDGELAGLLDDIPVSLEYRRGWRGDIDLAGALSESRARDIASGFTNAGIHRDDVLMTSNGYRVGEVLSRGQCKRLSLALLTASLKLVGQKTGKRIILLVDDLHSELDAQARQKAYESMAGLNLQLIISNIDERLPEGLGPKEFKMFHVEHGTIRPRIFS